MKIVDPGDKMIAALPWAVAHADWGTAPAKRQVATAVLQPNGRYLARPPQQVASTGHPLQRMGLDPKPPGRVVLGFDFPIGFPIAYARLAGLTDFRSALARLGTGEWSDFFRVANEQSEISLFRPFYPRSCATRGLRQRVHLYEALGLTHAQLLRECERAVAGRRDAAVMFWTLGAQQVGRAALDGWKEVLQTALADEQLDVALWPFDGDFHTLVAKRAVTIVETYPGAMYSHLQVRLRNKTDQAQRQQTSDSLLAWADGAGADLSDDLRAQIENGFGSESAGEDPFDAVVGLFGILNVLLGHRPAGDPEPGSAHHRVEGWILGR